MFGCMATFGWACCFCGGDIEERDPDPCALRVTNANGDEQMWACHSACFKQRLDADPMFEPIIFEARHDA